MRNSLRLGFPLSSALAMVFAPVEALNQMTPPAPSSTNAKPTSDGSLVRNIASVVEMPAGAAKMQPATGGNSLLFLLGHHAGFRGSMSNHALCCC